LDSLLPTSDARERRLDEPHVRPLMDVVRGLRTRGLDVPNVDPNDGGVNARVLFLLETPGPKAVASRFVSRDNPDPSARNIGRLLDESGFARNEVLLWNVVPQCLSTTTKNRNASKAEICDAAPDLQAFINLLPKLEVMVFCGLSAQRAIDLIRLPSRVQVLRTYHPGQLAYRQPKCRAVIHATFKQARRLISS
jgi:uracil-DNA glycosylase